MKIALLRFHPWLGSSLPGSRRGPAGLRPLWLLAVGLFLTSCMGQAQPCPTCPGEVDPRRLVDPRSLGDGSGYPGASWPKVGDPSRLGWSPQALRAAQEVARVMGSDGYVVVDRGVVVWEYGHSSKNLIVQSVRKSFLGALFGIALEEGRVDLNLTLGELGIDDLPPSLTPEEKTATIEHLLMCRSGVYHEAAAETRSMKASRPPRGSHPPGTFFYYNNWDFNALGTIYRQLTGEDIFQAIYDRLAKPLQMQEFSPSNGWYFYEPVSQHPAYHFTMSPRDMARFGLLILREGRWRDRQVIPGAWIERSLRPYSDAGSTWNYGYMWWVGKPQVWNGHSVVAALGGNGQGVFVVRDMEVVIAHKVDPDTFTGTLSQVYDLVRQILRAKVL